MFLFSWAVFGVTHLHVDVSPFASGTSNAGPSPGSGPSIIGPGTWAPCGPL